jgi:hypothetical protein
VTLTDTLTDTLPLTPTVAATDTATPAPVMPTPAPTTIPRALSTPRATIAADTRTFAPGDVVVGRNRRVAVYADANREASLLDSFGVNVELTVVEPSGDYGDYPVVYAGEQWLRVRALDGLVGWIVSRDVELK